MTRAYREIYLSKAQAALGDTFDYAVNACGIPGEDFVKLFITSTISRRMENGEPSVLAGKSGIELASDVMLETTGKSLDAEPAGSSAAQGNTGSAGPWPITNGIRREAIPKYSKHYPLMSFRECTIRSMKPIFLNSRTLRMKGSGNISRRPI